MRDQPTKDIDPVTCTISDRKQTRRSKVQAKRRERRPAQERGREAGTKRQKQRVDSVRNEGRPAMECGIQEKETTQVRSETTTQRSAHGRGKRKTTAKALHREGRTPQRQAAPLETRKENTEAKQKQENRKQRRAVTEMKCTAKHPANSEDI